MSCGACPTHSRGCFRSSTAYGRARGRRPIRSRVSKCVGETSIMDTSNEQTIAGMATDGIDRRKMNGTTHLAVAKLAKEAGAELADTPPAGGALFTRQEAVAEVVIQSMLQSWDDEKTQE